MSLSNRLYRLARSKLNELKEWLDRVEEEQAGDSLRAKERAQEELDEAITPSSPSTMYTPSVPNTRSTPKTAPSPQITDPLYYHYRLLGLQPGADLSAVQAAYKRYTERANPVRFPPGSPEEAIARDILQKLDRSYQILCEALDPTLRRFELLEFDPSANPQKEEQRPSEER